MRDDVDPMKAVELELESERASALGEAGRRLERALAALDDRDQDEQESIAEVATAVWYYMIVRESLHMYDHEAALAIYRVPRHVMARVGIVQRATPPRR